MKEQRRGRRIAMSPGELDAFLTEERTCRLGTARPGRAPHVTPLWFVWDGSAIWLYSTVATQRWKDIELEPQISVLVDAGVGFDELRGAEMTGSVVVVGEVPRAGAPNDLLREPEEMFARKYRESGTMAYDERHAWLRLSPDKVVSWDFRKMK